MRVVVNGLFLAPPMGGVETYLRELCRGLLARPDAPRLTVLLNPAGYDKLVTEDWAAGAELVRAEQLGRAGLRAVSELAAVGLVADRRRADVVHSVAMTGPLVAARRGSSRSPDTVWITHPEDTFNQPPSGDATRPARGPSAPTALDGDLQAAPARSSSATSTCRAASSTSCRSASGTARRPSHRRRMPRCAPQASASARADRPERRPEEARTATSSSLIRAMVPSARPCPTHSSSCPGHPNEEAQEALRIPGRRARS